MSSAPSLSSIRPANVADAGGIAEVHVRSWQWAYRGLIPGSILDALSVERRASSHAQRLSSTTEHRTWVAEHNDSIVGFAVAGPNRDHDTGLHVGEIGALYLLPQVAGTGIGRALFTHACADLQHRGFTSATLWVLESNIRARAFYERANWRADGASKAGNHGDGLFLHQIRYRGELISSA